MDDGNKALYTGSNGEQGFFDLGVDMARQTFSGLEGDYTMSVAIALPGVGALDQYCWAYGFSNGTEQYVGLVNSPDNTGWYYTIKDGESADAPSHGGLSYGEWHHIAYVQEGNMGAALRGRAHGQ